MVRRRQRRAVLRAHAAPVAGLLQVTGVGATPVATSGPGPARMWRWRRRISSSSRLRASRSGSSPARQRISSVSRLPRPAIRCWSMSRALSGAVLDAQRRPQLAQGEGERVGAERLLVGVQDARRPGDAGPACGGGRRPRSRGRSGPTPARPGCCRRSGRRARRRGRPRSRPVMPKRRPSTGPSPPSVSSRSSFPRRRAAVSVRPIKADRAVAPSRPSFRYQASSACTSATVRPSASTAWRRYNSISRISGTAG